MKRHLIPWIGVATALPVFACPRCLDLPPALETHARQADVFHFLPDGSTRFGGPVGDLMRVTAGEWFDAKTLAEMADVFRRRPNGFATGEFWGKATRALSRHVAATGDPRLRALLDATLADLISTQDANGCISGYKPDRQPYNTDVWDRKYVLLGLLHGYSVTRDSKVLEAAKRAADHMLTQLGPPPKVRVYDTHYITHPPRQEGGFQGMESTSVLEPFAWLHLLTGKKEYLDFCRYLIEEEGGSKRGSIFKAALTGGDVKDFGGDGTPRGTVAHAYNIISVFEGMSQYHRATGEPKWRQAILNVHRNISEKENTIIGASCGLGPNQGLASTEQFSLTAFHQTLPVQEGLEGCTHARWMGLNLHLLRLTGDPAYADAFEVTLYNSLLGSVRPDGKQVDYHTWLNGTRPAKMNYRQTFNGKVITCCVFNVLDSLALPASAAVMLDREGPVMNLYLPGSTEFEMPQTGKVRLVTETDYPRTGKLLVRIEATGGKRFPIRFRIPGWSTHSRVVSAGDTMAATPGSYVPIEREWKAGDMVELDFDLSTRLVSPPLGTPAAGRGFRALTRGPLVLARDRRLGGDLHEGVEIKADEKLTVEASPMEPIPGSWVRSSIPTQQGGRFEVMDFASSGNTWDARSERMTWIPLPGATPPRWIWFAGDARGGVEAPVGKRWFRKTVRAPEGRSIRAVRAAVAADNSCTIHFNGALAGFGNNWQQPAKFEHPLAAPTKELVIAIEAENTVYQGPNAAGLIGIFDVTLDDGSVLTSPTGGSWKSASGEEAGWNQPGFDDSAWKEARVLGANGIPPWKRVALTDREDFKGGLGF